MFTFVLPFNVSAESETEDIAIWDGTYDTSWYDGEEKEFHITTAEEFAGFAELSNAEKLSSEQTIYLEADIYMNDISNINKWNSTPPKNKWKPIANNVVTINGNGHTISGLYGGLFEKNNSIIKNLHIKESCVYSNSTEYELYCGGLTVYNNGTIDHCSFSGEIYAYTVYSSGPSGYTTSFSYAGGICALSNGTISNCSNFGNVYAYSQKNYKQSEYVSNTWKSSSYAGGICGYNQAGLIENCSNNGFISAEAAISENTSVGGICGISLCGTIKNSYNTGNIISDLYAGGIVGKSTGNDEKVAEINNAYNIGMISNNIFGGVVGYNDSYSSLSACYYLSSSAVKGIGYGEDNTIPKNSANMQKVSFVESLGEGFVYNEGGYPLLKWEVPLKGDINMDGEINVADAVLLQKFILGNGTLKNWRVADLYADERIDVFDMVLMRKLLIDTLNL